MDQCLCDSDDTFNMDDQTAVAGTLDFQENTLLALERAGGNADAGAFGEIQFLRLEV